MPEPILIVDDDTDTCRLLMRLFEHSGIPAVFVHSGAAALLYFGVHTPPAVILDYTMPGMDGLEVLRQMRLMGGSIAAVPVAMYTAVSDVCFNDQAMLLGARDIWPKTQITFCEMRHRLAEWGSCKR